MLRAVLTSSTAVCYATQVVSEHERRNRLSLESRIDLSNQGGLELSDSNADFHIAGIILEAQELATLATDRYLQDDL